MYRVIYHYEDDRFYIQKRKWFRWRFVNFDGQTVRRKSEAFSFKGRGNASMKMKEIHRRDVHGPVYCVVEQIGDQD